MNITSTSKRTPPWSGGSSRSSSAQPSVEDTIAILRGLKQRYETHHGVRITDGAIVSAAILSDRYIQDRFFPDKAIDLIDEAASRLRIENDSMPAELDEIRRKTMQLQIEIEALRKEKDPASRQQMRKGPKRIGRVCRKRTRISPPAGKTKKGR